MITLSNCKVGYVYSLHSRNLELGVFTISNTFIGIRQKFDDKFLFGELHIEKGGTATPLKELVAVPEEIKLVESLGKIDHKTRLPVEFKKDNGWFFIDSGEYSKNIRPISVTNEKLFKFLSNL
jgi:hypothetical protein